MEGTLDTAKEGKEKLEKGKNEEFAFSAVAVTISVLIIIGNIVGHELVWIATATVTMLVFMTIIALRQYAVILGLRADVAAKDAEIVKLRDRENIFRSQGRNGDNAVKALFKAAAAICRDRTDVGARKARDEAALDALRMGIRIAHKDRELSPSMTNIWAWAPGTTHDRQEVAMFADLLEHRKGAVKEVLEQEKAPDDIARYFLGLEAPKPS